MQETEQKEQENLQTMCSGELCDIKVNSESKLDFQLICKHIK